LEVLNMSKLSDLITAAAERCEAEGVAIDGAVDGAVADWVWKNCEVALEQMFFVVTLITAEMADREARREGYEGQADRAAQRAFAKVGKAVSV
jgi:geranylgeranyl pyrophosphate synthase